MDSTFISLQSALAGEYSLERELGRGGMGIVYLAREVQLDRLVAIKALPVDRDASSETRERFLRESKTAAALSHPNIVPIHRVGEAHGIPYFVMTFVRGETLGERLRARGPISPSLLSRVMHDVALALGYAHGRGVIHRDVKPDNILIEEGTDRALVTDFGIARTLADETVDDSVMGTAHFMSPEQSVGASVDGRSDIYSLGVVAFLACSGKLPLGDLPAPDPAARARATAPPVSSVTTGLSAPLARVIDRCLERIPDNRFATAEQVAAAIHASTAPARAALPIPLRLWASTPVPMLSAYQLMAVTFGTLAANEAYERIFHRGSGSNLWDFVMITFIPVLPIALFQLRKTYRALAGGYTISDLRLALRTWTAERREEMAFESGANEPRWARIGRWVPLGLAAVITASVVVAKQFELGDVQVKLIGSAIQNTVYGAGLSFVFLTIMGVPMTPPAMRRRSVGRVQAWLWNSRFGGWLARLLTPRKRGVPESNFRPTELALGVAVDELYASLPTAYRSHVGDLPAIGAKLMTEAAWLRSEVHRLEDLRLHARLDETSLIDPMLAGAKSQLGRTISALEQMRLEMLRLHGGTTDLRPLTTSLDAAREMVDDIVRLREAEDEVSARPRRRIAIDARTPSPA